MKRLSKNIPTDAKTLRQLTKNKENWGTASFENGVLVKIEGPVIFKTTWKTKGTVYSYKTDSKGKKTASYKHPTTVITHKDLDADLTAFAKSKGLA